MPSRGTRFRVLSATRAGGAVNHDRHFMLPNAVLVLDGATGDEAGKRDGGWYAEQLGTVLAEILRESPDVDLTELLARAIEDVAGLRDLRPGSSPSSTVAILRWNDDTTDALVLGDSKITAVLRDRDFPRGLLSPDATPTKIEELCDQRITRVGRELRRRYQRRLKDGGGYDAEHDALIAELRDAERIHRNAASGYWIAEADPIAAHQSTIRTWPSAALLGVVLSTDGAWCGFTNYRLGTDPGRLAIQPEHADLATVLDAIHRAESSDPDGRRWPRSKCHDDKTVVTVTSRSDGRLSGPE